MHLPLGADEDQAVGEEVSTAVTAVGVNGNILEVLKEHQQVALKLQT